MDQSIGTGAGIWHLGGGDGDGGVDDVRWKLDAGDEVEGPNRVRGANYAWAPRDRRTGEWARSVSCQLCVVVFCDATVIGPSVASLGLFSRYLSISCSVLPAVEEIVVNFAILTC
jgi:hypothetical protein